MPRTAPTTSRYASGRKDAKRVVIGPTDIDLFKLLARYPYLNLSWLAFALDRKFSGVQERVKELKQAGYIKIAEAQRDTPEAQLENLHKPLCHDLAPKAIKLLHSLGIDVAEKTTNILDHQAMASQIMVSFEKGAVGTLRMMHWPEILDREETPPALRNNPHPFAFKHVSYSYRGHHHKKDVRPDGQPFGIEADAGDELHEFFFPGIEADNGTEPMELSEWGRSSIERKFCEYAAVAEQKLYLTQFGFPHIYVPFVFSKAERVRTALRLLHDIELPMRLKKIFLFGVHSSAPNDNMLKVPFQRLTADGPQPFSFVHKKEAA